MKRKRHLSVELRNRARGGLRAMDAIHRILKIQSIAMFKKLDKLVSKDRKSHKAARRIKLVLKGRRPESRSKKRWFKREFTIPLRTDRSEKYLINFWHQLSRTEMRSRIIEHCSNVPVDIIKASRFVNLEAEKFVTLHLHPSRLTWDPNYLNELEQASKEYKLEWDDDLPLTKDHVNIMLNLQPTPVKVESPRAVGVNKTRVNLAHIRHLHPPLKDRSKRLRQTTIDEYFKPRQAVSLPKFKDF